MAINLIKFNKFDSMANARFFLQKFQKNFKLFDGVKREEEQALISLNGTQEAQ